MQEVKDSPDALSVKVSQYEVYNEQIYDLLAEEAGAVLGHRPALRLKEDSQGRIFVRDLSEVGWFLAAIPPLSCNHRGPRSTCCLIAAGAEPPW